MPPTATITARYIISLESETVSLDILLVLLHFCDIMVPIWNILCAGSNEDSSWELALLSAYSVKYAAMHDYISHTAVYKEFVTRVIGNAVGPDDSVIFGVQT